MHISAQRKYKVTLSDKDKQSLKTLTHKGTAKARIITRARILLLANQELIQRIKMKQAEDFTDYLIDKGVSESKILALIYRNERLHTSFCKRKQRLLAAFSLNPI
ncbi:MAG: hypothetical protein HYT83_03275 [Candidatus Levybacteria bacterium]|nr:hypothetical protein [Candidatus Levybacteria bacterium]